MHDAADFVSFTGFFKAMPAEEAGRRMIYFEAANEARDLQGEKVLVKALADSAAYYLRYGNVDVDHVTQIGMAKGIPNYNQYEIGRPVDVKLGGDAAFVKAELFRGEGAAAQMANDVWDSLTAIQPPARWYPSVGGAVLERGREMDPRTREVTPTIAKVRWTNVGLSRTPVNTAVPTVSTVPVGTLAKSWGPAGLNLRKSLEAGYGTDSAALTGGGALRKQSLDRQIQNYWDFRERVAGDLRSQRVGQSARAIQAHAATHLGLSHDQAAEWTERFFNDLRAGRTSPKGKQ